MLIIISKLYRTVSYVPATVICGTLPLKFEMTIRAAIYEKENRKNVGPLILKKEEGKSDLVTYKSKLYTEAVKTWQTEWNESTKGAWTKKVLP